LKENDHSKDHLELKVTKTPEKSPKGDNFNLFSEKINFKKKEEKKEESVTTYKELNEMFIKIVISEVNKVNDWYQKIGKLIFHINKNRYSMSKNIIIFIIET
jgi:hypothetical protein